MRGSGFLFFSVGAIFACYHLYQQSGFLVSEQERSSDLQKTLDNIQDRYREHRQKKKVAQTIISKINEEISQQNEELDAQKKNLETEEKRLSKCNENREKRRDLPAKLEKLEAELVKERVNGYEMNQALGEIYSEKGVLSEEVALIESTIGDKAKELDQLGEWLKKQEETNVKLTKIVRNLLKRGGQLFPDDELVVESFSANLEELKTHIDIKEGEEALDERLRKEAEETKAHAGFEVEPTSVSDPMMTPPRFQEEEEEEELLEEPEEEIPLITPPSTPVAPRTKPPGMSEDTSEDLKNLLKPSEPPQPMTPPERDTPDPSGPEPVEQTYDYPIKPDSSEDQMPLDSYYDSDPEQSDSGDVQDNYANLEIYEEP